ncbi:MAG: outer membrane beta-barrel domain-containing protein [Candidatus Magnetomorum sp.]|nr:outer membrane beta-barrel domain-containing protein [Candidatus Magnetomorum sp.]
MKSWINVIISLLLLSFAPWYVYADDSSDLTQKDHIYVIQEKIFHRYHETGLFMSYVPDDDFYDSFALGANYVFHITDVFSWEVFRAAWMTNQEKSLKDDIERSLDITPTHYDEPNYMVHSQFWFRPFYGKSAVLNKRIIFHETGLFAGIGMIGFDQKKSFGNNANDTALSVSCGLGTTFFLNSYSGVSFHIRNLMHFKKDQTENRISLEMGYSFRFNLNPRKKHLEPPTLDRFHRYISSDVSNDELYYNNYTFKTKE